MQCYEKSAYEELIEELKNEIPFFKKYNEDFFYKNKKFKDLSKRENHHFDNIYKLYEEKKNITDYCNLLVEEMDNNFKIIENNKSIHNICNYFLQNLDENVTNNYYDFINLNYVSSKNIRDTMITYLKNNTSQNMPNKDTNHNKKKMTKKKISNKANNNGNNISNNHINNHNSNIYICKHNKSSYYNYTVERVSKMYNKRKKSYLYKKYITNRTSEKIHIKIKKGKNYIRKELKNIHKTKHNMKLHINNNKKKKILEKKKHSFEEEIKNKEDLGFSDISFIPFINDNFHINYGAIMENANSQLFKNVYIIDNIKKNEPFQTSFNLKSLQNHSYQQNKKNNNFIYTNLENQNDIHTNVNNNYLQEYNSSINLTSHENFKINTSASYNRLIILDDQSGKKKLLENVRKNSLVKGWIYKLDFENKCFFIKIYSIKNDKYDDEKVQFIKTDNEKNDNFIYACLPFEFINKYEFLQCLNINGLSTQNFQHLIGTNICAHIFHDSDYINTHFKNILNNFYVHFFITFNSKYYYKNEKVGFLSNMLSNNLIVSHKNDQNDDDNNDDNKDDNYNNNNNYYNMVNLFDHLLNNFKSLLYSSKKFLNITNLNYKKEFLQLHHSNISSHIHFHCRNMSYQPYIGNIITLKQNLIWANEKFLEAFKIYRNNSKYFVFLKNFFNFDFSYIHNGKYVYVYEQNNFVIEYDKSNHNMLKNIKKCQNKLDTHNDNLTHNEYNNSSKGTYSSKIKKERVDEQSCSSNTDTSINPKKKKKKKIDKNYINYYQKLNHKEKYIFKNVIFLNPNLYKSKWIYDFLNCIKLTINLNDQHVLANFLLSLVLLELSCYSESFLFLHRIFKIKKAFLESYKLKKIIFSVFIKQLKKYVKGNVLWNVIINFQKYDLFNMTEQNSEEYCTNIFKRNVNIINTFENM
ncbi:conserved Plasmodium protein, unknown function [Plasmodium sp. gorilla clade G2]|uniref:conserved Plasmodium protein, unknown function n=1 Tax=Plasmodium sp. gorilla clade G2 TaxID=880535 RepID=UPI000D2192AC|nr:conserved Plasmodium protein, unknown function [Plasmodium sp. gorilla clade G2]SOV13226.1 conserved Plasmodium protein, unknown function [Plasmodium sp. gorilla clade G2]